MKIKQTVKRYSTIGLLIGLFVVPALVMPSTSTQALDCAVLPQSICESAQEKDLESSGLWMLLLLVLNILTFGVAVVGVAMIGYAAFIYTTAQNNSSQTKQAIDMIRNVIVGIVAYILMWAFLQYLIPGGVFA